MILFCLFISVTLCLCIFFFTLRKRNHPLTLIFILMINEFVFTTFISIVVDNEERWKVTEEVKHFIMFRIVEVVLIPLILLLYTEWLLRSNSTWRKALITFLWIVLLLFVEFAAIQGNIYQHKRWEYWMSFILWFTLLFLTAFSQVVFQKLLRREGIIQ